MKRFHPVVPLVSLLGSLTLSCGAEGDSGGNDTAGDDSVSHVALEVTAVPSGVACIQVTVQAAGGGAPFVTQNFASTPGANWAASVGLGTFVEGDVIVRSLAFVVACASVTAASTPTWVADEMPLGVAPGVSQSMVLNFRQNLSVIASANFAPTVVQVSTGMNASAYRLADGTVRTLGVLAAPPVSFTGVAELAMGYNHACARKTDGTVWCWGNNSNGQLGNGTTTGSFTTPVQVSGISGATSVAAGFQVSCASNSVTVYCWGWGLNGALGNNTTTDKLVATAIVGASGRVQKISTSGYHTCAITYGGDLNCWGRNASGQLGDGSTTNRLTPVWAGIYGATSVATGEDHTCAADASGALYCWGDNGYGQLGTGNTTNSSTNLLVAGLTDIAEVIAARDTTCTRSATGDVSCWGDAYHGGVGDGSGGRRLNPVMVHSGAAQISGGGYGGTVLDLDKDGSTWAWGDGQFGQIDSSFSTRFLPTKQTL